MLASVAMETWIVNSPSCDNHNNDTSFSFTVIKEKRAENIEGAFARNIFNENWAFLKYLILILHLAFFSWEGKVNGNLMSIILNSYDNEVCLFSGQWSKKKNTLHKIITKPGDLDKGSNTAQAEN